MVAPKFIRGSTQQERSKGGLLNMIIKSYVIYRIVISNDLQWPLNGFKGIGTFQMGISQKWCILETKLV